MPSILVNAHVAILAIAEYLFSRAALFIIGLQVLIDIWTDLPSRQSQTSAWLVSSISLELLGLDLGVNYIYASLMGRSRPYPDHDTVHLSLRFVDGSYIFCISVDIIYISFWVYLPHIWETLFSDDSEYGLIGLSWGLPSRVYSYRTLELSMEPGASHSSSGSGRDIWPVLGLIFKFQYLKVVIYVIV